ncbi:SEL1-like repeat protein [bacterium]|nr:SEL1-like repeat protein [bacterium]
MLKVGRCYERGDGVEKDKDKAVFWYKKAAIIPLCLSDYD